MRFVFLLLLLTMFSWEVDAQKTALEIIQEKPVESWKKGPWTEERMAQYEGFDLAALGKKFLLGRNVEKDIVKAKILFERAAQKDASNFSLIGGFYTNYTNDHANAIEWFTRGIEAGDDFSKKWLGLEMYIIGKKLLNEQFPGDPPEIEGMAWLFAATHFGNKQAKLRAEFLKHQISEDKIKSIGLRSAEILDDPGLNFRILKGLKITPQQGQ